MQGAEIEDEGAYTWVKS